MFTFLKISSLIVLTLIGFFGLFIVFNLFLNPALGDGNKNDELLKTLKSPNIKNGVFINSTPTEVSTPLDHENSLKVALNFFFGNKSKREPKLVLPSKTINIEKYKTEITNNFLITWLGHSTLLVKTESTTLIIDPILSKRASPSQLLGPKRFSTEESYTFNSLPPIDAVLISHDHYDHLDYETIKHFNATVKKFYVPLGVKAHLLRWKVPEENIVVLDWHEGVRFKDVDIIFTPARHFSGRAFTDRMKTLWGSWVIKGKTKSLFHSGDSGYGEHFSLIGEKYGPFDFAFIECGAYNKNWSEIHMFPEEVVQAAIELNAKWFMPIHNSGFNLSIHGWRDPLDRVLKASRKKKVPIATPLIGETFTLSNTLKTTPWWQSISY